MKHLLCILLLCSSTMVQAQSYQEYVKMAMEALEKDSLHQAEALFRKALEKDPAIKSNAILFDYLGQIQERRGELKDALDSYSMGHNISPTTLSILLNRASLYMRMNNEKRALVDYNEVLDLNADHPEALFFRAYIYMQEHNYKQARTDYEHLIRLEPNKEPNNVEAQLGLVLLNDKDNRPREAMEQMNALIQLYPARAQLYVTRAGMEQDRQQHEVALHDYNQAIELDPTNAEYYIARGTYYLNVKKKKLAKADFTQAVKYGADEKDVAALLNEYSNK